MAQRVAVLCAHGYDRELPGCGAVQAAGAGRLAAPGQRVRGGEDAVVRTTQHDQPTGVPVGTECFAEMLHVPVLLLVAGSGARSGRRRRARSSSRNGAVGRAVDAFERFGCALLPVKYDECAYYRALLKPQREGRTFQRRTGARDVVGHREVRALSHLAGKVPGIRPYAEELVPTAQVQLGGERSLSRRAPPGRRGRCTADAPSPR